MKIKLRSSIMTKYLNEQTAGSNFNRGLAALVEALAIEKQFQ